ncbi:MAG: hypothetical protein QOG03_2340 [Actinomycetota bacterium]|nr:hypothetical protein [Actinomycetota bacterium]
MTALAGGGQNVGVATERRPEPDHLRASNADRERVATLLREQCAQGRLTLEEFDERLGKTLAAKTFGDLKEPLRDLPVLFDPARPTAVAPVRSPRPSTQQAGWTDTFRGHFLCYATTMVFLIIVWLLTSGPTGYFWPVWPILGWGLPVALHGLNARKPNTGS